MKTVLVSLDSQYIHTNLAIRSLCASCPPAYSPIVREYNINQQPHIILRELLALQPDLICFSCYLWNIDLVLRLCGDLKRVHPQVSILLGGPEVSFHAKELLEQHQEIDYILCGEGEESFPRLLAALSKHQIPALPGVLYRADGKIEGDGRYQLVREMEHLPFPYSQGEIPGPKSGRLLYYETSRGCPFSCSYCLSGAMGGGIRELPLERVKQELLVLIQSQAPIIKLVDRTFNANPKRAKEIVRFLIQAGGNTRFHFEVGADLLDEEFLDLFASSPKGKFQLEAGVQSCNVQTLNAVVRHTNMERLRHNVEVLMHCGKVHLHLDLIAGLPYEDMQSFAHSFNEVYSMQPHQLQLGFLKLLKGSSLESSAEGYGIVCRPYPPYEVLSTPWITCEELLHLKEIEETVERYYNSGRARRGMQFLIGRKIFPSAFSCYEALSNELQKNGCLDRPMSAANQLEALGEWALALLPESEHSRFLGLLKLDYLSSGAKGAVPPIFHAIQTTRRINDSIRLAKQNGKITEYQARHAKFDFLPLHPETLFSTETFVMVENSIRDELTGECKVSVIDE